MNRTRLFAAATVLAATLLSNQVRADVDLRQIVVEYKLKNGMKWLLVQRKSAPVFTAYIRVKAGGADEVAGKTGIAHLLEHLAFKGTKVIGAKDWQKEAPLEAQIIELGDQLAQLQRQPTPPEDQMKQVKAKIADLSKQARELEVDDAVSEIFARNGASGMNATTDKDMTSYFVSLPSNRLELWALVDSSRLAAPVPRDFYAERSVVEEERRLRVESEPIGVLFEELSNVAFTASPYRWPTVGYFNDLESLNVSDALNFHSEHYIPANTVGALVGDIDLDATKALLDRTFGTIPARPLPPMPPMNEVAQSGERFSYITFDASPQVVMGWHKPTLPSRDDYVFDVIQIVLSEGTTSRLWRSLVTEKQIAAQVFGAMLPGARLPHLFAVGATPLEGHTVEEVQRAVQAEIERLQKEPVSPRELEQVRNKLQANLSREIATNAGLAGSLTYFDLLTGDWRYLADHQKQIETITPEDVMRVAKTYLLPKNRTTVVLSRNVPGPQAPEKPQPAAPEAPQAPTKGHAVSPAAPKKGGPAAGKGGGK